jgi:hypothetical protein
MLGVFFSIFGLQLSKIYFRQRFYQFCCLLCDAFYIMLDALVAFFDVPPGMQEVSISNENNQVT